MVNENKEANRDALDGLPANERKETEEILNEIDADEKAKGNKPEDGGKSKEETPPKEEKKPEDKKPEDGKPPKDDSKKPEPRRPIKMMPAYIHEIEKSKFEKEKGELMAKIEALSKGKPPAEEGKNDKKDTNIDERLKELAEESGIDVKVLKTVLDLARENGGKVPDGVDTKAISEAIGKVDKLTAEREQEIEEAKFSSDFDAKIVPLIKAEYGDDVPQNVISDIREDLKEIAYSKEYEKIPYEEIYNGKTQFRDIIAPKKKSAEGSRGGTGESDGSGADDLDLTKPLSDDQMKNLSDAQFDTYCKNMDAREKKS